MASPRQYIPVITTCLDTGKVKTHKSIRAAARYLKTSPENIRRVLYSIQYHSKNHSIDYKYPEHRKYNRKIQTKSNKVIYNRLKRERLESEREKIKKLLDIPDVIPSRYEIESILKESENDVLPKK